MRYTRLLGMGMGKIKVIALAIALFTGLNSHAQLTETQYKEVGERLRALYEPKITSDQYTLLLKLDWQDTGMAYANHFDNYKQYEVTVTGDYARDPGLSSDAFSLVLCHEFGHLFGGAPYAKLYLSSNEGQADYYSTLKCFKALAAKEDNAAIVKSLGNQVTQTMRQQCGQVYPVGSRDSNICLRGMVAAYNLIHSKNPKVALSLTKKDPSESYMWGHFDHPEPQCRLDTLIAGLLCNNTRKLSNTDYRAGTCTAASGHKIGLRPRCWFNPETN